jgi:hypothetical protein
VEFDLAVIVDQHAVYDLADAGELLFVGFAAAGSLQCAAQDTAAGPRGADQRGKRGRR